MKFAEFVVKRKVFCYVRKKQLKAKVKKMKIECYGGIYRVGFRLSIKHLADAWKFGSNRVLRSERVCKKWIN